METIIEVSEPAYAIIIVKYEGMCFHRKDAEGKCFVKPVYKRDIPDIMKIKEKHEKK